MTLHANLVAIEVSLTPATSPAELIVEFTKIVEAITKSNLLTSAMQEQLTNIETQRGTTNEIWADLVLAQGTYEDAVDAYNEQVSPEEQVQADPIPDTVPVNNLYLCAGPCSTPFETQVLATTSHKIFCQEPPHNGSSQYSYYSCPPDYANLCPGSYVHQKPCRGGCGTLFETTRDGVPEDESHRKECDESTSRHIFNFWTGNCVGWYYSCNGQTSADCNNASAHIKTRADTSNTVEKDSSASNPTPLPCGHAVGSEGIHLRVSCEFCSEQFYFCAEGSEHGLARCPRNDKGETCTVSGGRMILCADPSHVHQYPSDPKQAQADASSTSESNTDKNDGKTPKQTGASKEMVLAACGVHTIEKGSSSRHDHRRIDCPLDVHGNACDPGSYYVCQASKHRHQYPNTPKGFRKVLCPANAWTGCGSTVSHPKTCAAGHSYYTCNAAAKTAHEAHTASDASPKSPPKETDTPAGDSSEGVRKCGHPKSQGGDHTFVASCTETNSKGESCERTSGYWTCKGHTHKFPNGDSNANTNKGGDSSEGVRKCGHPKSQGGDHTFVASCTETNANGD
ncbi:MAG: hypothetical protein OXN25_21205, partial [Candidatus Poribacteria bacterium]|nr:hypothetical protein [Candidatus Poribacteria bacterium]